MEGKARSKGKGIGGMNHDLRMELRNGFGRWMEAKSEENKVSFQFLHVMLFPVCRFDVKLYFHLS